MILKYLKPLRLVNIFSRIHVILTNPNPNKLDSSSPLVNDVVEEEVGCNRISCHE